MDCAKALDALREEGGVRPPTQNLRHW
jgi:hypothetical protein